MLCSAARRFTVNRNDLVAVIPNPVPFRMKMDLRLIAIDNHCYRKKPPGWNRSSSPVVENTEKAEESEWPNYQQLWRYENPKQVYTKQTDTEGNHLLKISTLLTLQNGTYISSKLADEADCVYHTMYRRFTTKIYRVKSGELKRKLPSTTSLFVPSLIYFAIYQLANSIDHNYP